jgi:NAD(P)-dependent dehydrogenase (short-subunit alcohol dehydrogenase family)
MLNLQAALTCGQRANEMMQAQPDGGCIINIGSVTALRASPGTAAYGAAKAGLINLTASLAVEWAPKVRVNCVSAGLILTEQAHLHYDDEMAITTAAATVPLGRLGTAQDVADACVFLASPLAQYISGANVDVHGGGERTAADAAASQE